jgi:hypothetical protein
MSAGNWLKVSLAPTRQVRVLLLLLTFLPFSQAHGASLFDNDTVLDVTLTGPLQSVFDSRASRTQLPFVLQANGIDHHIAVRARGNSRLKLCKFPLLRLNFKKNELSGSVFDGQDKLKLVTHCRSFESSQVDLLQEYAAYKIFEEISDIAYKTRLMRVTYVETEGSDKGEQLTRYAFLIEPESKFETRIAGQRQMLPGIAPSALNDEQAALAYVFHYLIGNTDWSLVTADGAQDCCHNGHLYDINGQIYLVPNDFDLSGLVNARYAKPDRSVGISRVTQRRYRGFCLPTEVLSKALTVIRSKEQEILNVFDHIPGLNDKETKRSKNYLRSFFKDAANHEKLLQKFEKSCLS